jgi:hypothetical protein
VNRELLDFVVTWCRERSGLAADTPV